MFAPFKYKPQGATKFYQFKTRFNHLLESPLIKRDRPRKPIGIVNQHVIGLANMVQSSFRTIFILPWLVGLCLTLYWQVGDFYASWKSHEKQIVHFVNHRKELYGEDYFEKKVTKAALDMYQELDAKGEIPFSRYWHYRYYETAAAERFRRGDIVLAIFYLISIPGLSYLALRMKRIAPLYFDRERRIVYSWRGGRVLAQYYDDVWLYQNNRGIDFALYGFKEGHPQHFFYTLQPGGTPWYNNAAVMEPAFASIVKFMEEGRDVVFDKDWEGRRGFFLREDKKPDDFAEQLEKVLTFISDEKLNERGEEQAKEWGFLDADERA